MATCGLQQEAVMLHRNFEQCLQCPANFLHFLKSENIGSPNCGPVGVWVEITNKSGEKHIVRQCDFIPRGDVKLFTDQIDNSLSKTENDRTIKHSVITGDFNTDLIKFDLTLSMPGGGGGGGIRCPLKVFLHNSKRY